MTEEKKVVVVEPFDVLVVDASLSGATLARKCADAGLTVKVVAEHNQLGGFCRDFVDPETKCIIPLCGASMLHTNNEEVMEFLCPFGTWHRYDHKAMAEVTINDKVLRVPVPPNMNTLNPS